MNILTRSHPLVCIAFLILAAVVTALSQNPAITLLSLAGGLMLAAFLGKLKNIGFVFGISALSAAANFLFVHRGKTGLFFVGDTLFTLEALLCGVQTGLMLSAVCLWGICSSEIITSDKYIWLTGRIFPSAGLVLSCAVRFVPLFIRTSKEFISIQGSGTLKDFLKAFSASVGYSAECTMDSALSMKARGFGTGKRTCFSLYRFDLNAAAMLISVFMTGGISLALVISGVGSFYFYPALSDIPAHAYDILLYALFGIFCFMPAAAAAYEKICRNAAFRRDKNQCHSLK